MSAGTSVPTFKKIEDYLLSLLPLITALAGFQWGGIIPGTTGFLVGVFLGAFAKFLIGLSQDPTIKNWEDLVPLIVITLGFISTTLSANPQFLEVGTIIGFIVKALGYFTAGGTSTLVEDAFLIIGAFLMLYGAFIGNPQVVDAGALLGIIGKSFPGIAGATKLTPTVSAPTPTSAG